jgi:4,5-DOPA dioxygenase extradiol
MPTQPVLFVAHGSPMLAVEPDAWGAALGRWAADLRDLKAVLVVSAHWEAPAPIGITSAAAPGTLHDFGGFPERLYTLQYPAPGDPALAARVLDLLTAAGIPARLDPDRPRDHGAWVPLMNLRPQADLPVLQLALPRPRSPRQLFELGQALRPLRAEGVLIVGSGGIVHNLGRLDWNGGGAPAPWAQGFADWVGERLERGAFTELIDGCAGAPGFQWAVPTTEHFDPLFLTLGAADGSPAVRIFDGWQLGSLSLATWAFA